MIVYLDASALVKRYVRETGSDQVHHLIDQARLVGTCLISRAKVAAAIGKAMRVKLLTRDEASAAVRVFRAQWTDLIRVQLAETIVAQADALAWEHGLRGYDAVHLAAALFWQEAMSETVTLATFDHQLWQAGQKAGMSVWPQDFEQFAGSQA